MPADICAKGGTNDDRCRNSQSRRRACADARPLGTPRQTESSQQIQTKNQKERENRSMVTVESIKPITGAGNLRAFAIVNIADRLRVHDVRIIQQPGQEAWVSMPSRAYEKDGQR